MSKAIPVSTKPPSGTRDFLPADIARRRYVTGVIEEVYQRFGFAPLETPAFENLSVLLGKYGSEGDQLLFRLLHRRDALTRALAKADVQEGDLGDLGLRYDLTVPLARVVAQYPALPRFFKRYQIQPVWRADRPARGRFREFFQCDLDVIGTKSLLAEAEVCTAVALVLERLGFSDFTLRINHRGLLRSLIRVAGIDDALESVALVALDKLDKVGAAGVHKELAARGISAAAATRLLDSVGGGADDDSATLRSLSAQLDEDGQQASETLLTLKTLLGETAAGRHLRLCPELARGLSYYTGPIFELAVADLSGSIGGGGRYDGLIGMFASQDLAAVGCSLGLERILLLMEERGMYPPLRSGPDAVLCWLDVALPHVLSVAQALRDQGLRVEVFPEAAKLGKQLQYADHPAIKAPLAIILGQTEWAEGTVVIKHLASGKQVSAALADAASTAHELNVAVGIGSASLASV